MKIFAIKTRRPLQKKMETQTPPKVHQKSGIGRILQRAQINPMSLTPQEVMQLQGTIGNQAVCRLFDSSSPRHDTVQMAKVKTKSFGVIDTQKHYKHELRLILAKLLQNDDGEAAIQINTALKNKDYKPGPFLEDIVTENKSDEDSEYKDESFEEMSNKRRKRRRKNKSLPEEFETFDMFKLKNKKKSKTKKKKKAPKKTLEKLKERSKLKKKKGKLQRPQDYGPVKIKLETIEHISLGKIQRPINVSGKVFPVTTSNRPPAPESISGLKVSVKWKDVGSKTTRNTGVVDAQKGHIMALELGGPDIPSNIVPQWGNWQANGAWRKVEKKILKLAEVLKKKGHFLHFDATVIYKSLKSPQLGSQKGITFPIAFKVTVIEMDKSRKAVDKGTIVFNGQQEQDETDFKVSGKIFDKVDKEILPDTDIEMKDKK